jgi:hypothetical protein
LRRAGDNATRDPGTSLRAVVALFEAIQGGEIAVIELELGRGHVLLEVRDRARAGNTTVVSSTTITCATPTTARISQRREYVGSAAVIERSWVCALMRCPFRPDFSKFEQLEAERLDLPKDAEQRGPILEQTGEHGLAAFQLRHHRGKRRQGGRSEPAPYPDRVQARQSGHAIILQPDLVSRRRRNLVIVRTPVLALLRRCSGAPG